MPTTSRPPNRFVKWATAVLVGVIAILSAAIVLTGLQALELIQLEIVSKLSGLSTSVGVLQLLGIGIAGVVLMLQALIANSRARAMEEAAAAQADAARAHATANFNTEKGQRQERLKNAIEHLGSDSESVRLGGAYELFHLAEDTASLRQTVLDILCAHIRRTTGEDWYMDKYKSQPSEEIASLLAQLFVYGHEVFSGYRVNLRESRLNGADLRGARLAGADLRSAQLDNALLNDARLERVDLSAARLKRAQLRRACLREASLIWVHLQGALLEDAQLQGAIIQGGHLAAATIRGGSLQGANLSSAELYGVDLISARLEGARLSWANLQGAMLDDANLRGAGDFEWNWSSSYAERIRVSVGKDSIFSSVNTGGLKRERVDQIINELESPLLDPALTAQLHPYIGAPHRLGLPEGHGAILGSYSQVEAARWIAEHESAMKAVAESGSSTPGL